MALQKQEKDNNGLFNQSLEKGLDVLLSFGPDRETMNLSEIAQAAGISKSAAQRFTYTLEKLGYLHKDPVSKRFSLTVATLALGYRYLQVNSVVERANPFLLDLNRTCGEIVNFSEPDKTDMVYVGRFPSPQTTPVHMPLGRRLPIYCTSAGRAYLSTLPVEERIEILNQSDRVAYTQSTITDVDRLLELCEEARLAGYAHASSEYYPGDINVSAAAFGASGKVSGVVTISAPSIRWTVEKARKELAPLVIETARLISTREPSADQLQPFSIGTGRAAAGR